MPEKNSEKNHALLDSESLFKALVEQASDAFYLHDLEGNILEVNQKACECLGYTRAELLTLNVSDVEPQMEEKKIKEAWQKFKPGQTFSVESLHRRKDGTSFPVDVRIKLLVINNNKKCILALARDISVRKKSEKLLKESEERLWTLLESISDGLLVADLETKKFVANNSRICAMLGYECEELLNIGIADIHPQKDLPAVIDKLERQVRGEITLADNIPVLRKDRTIFYADINSSPFYFQGRYCIIGVFRDVTARRKAEDALRKTEARQALILRSLPMAFYVARPFGDFGGTWVSEQIDEISGFTVEHFKADIGLWAERLHPDDRVRVMSAFESLPVNETLTVEYRWQHADGRYRWFQDNAVLVRDESGEPIEVIGTWLDISDRKKAEEDLRQAQKMESIGNLAGGIAHDFNNILMAIFGNIGLAKMKVDKSEQLYTYLERINQSATRAKELVEQILTFSRRTEQHKHPVKVGPILKEAMKLLRASIPKTIEIREEIDSQATVMSDPTQLHQVFMNLCTNAYHAMRETGGILKIALREIEVTLDDFIMGFEIGPGRYVQLEVSDTGCGMDRKTRERIFEPYFTTKKYGDGVGLGLAVVHGIVSDLNGQIAVYSEKNKGSTFQVYLPVSEMPAAAEESIQEIEIPAGGNENLMLVDDEHDNIILIKEILTNHGYSVEVFYDGVQAWQAFQEQPAKYDLVITDMTMPLMTGAELARKMIEIRPELPIMLCTGYSDLINRERSLAMGIREYVQKPMTVGQLLKSVRQVLDRKV